MTDFNKWEKYSVDDALKSVESDSLVREDGQAEDKWAKARYGDISNATEESSRIAAIMESQLAVETLLAAGKSIVSLRRARRQQAGSKGVLLSPAPSSDTSKAPATLQDKYKDSPQQPTASAPRPFANAPVSVTAAAGPRHSLAAAMSAFGDLMRKLTSWISLLRKSSANGASARGVGHCVKCLHGLSALSELRKVIGEELGVDRMENIDAQDANDNSNDSNGIKASDSRANGERASVAVPFSFVKKAVKPKKERNAQSRRELVKKLDRGMESILLQSLFFGAICSLDSGAFTLAADWSRAFLKLQWESAQHERQLLRDGTATPSTPIATTTDEAHVRKMWAVRGLAFGGMGSAFVCKRHIDAVAGHATGYTGVQGRAKSGAGIGSLAGAATASVFMEAHLASYVTALDRRDVYCSLNERHRTRGNRLYGADVWLLTKEIRRLVGSRERNSVSNSRDGSDIAGNCDLIGPFVRLRHWFKRDVDDDTIPHDGDDDYDDHDDAAESLCDEHRSQRAFAKVRAALGVDEEENGEEEKGEQEEDHGGSRDHDDCQEGKAKEGSDGTLLLAEQGLAGHAVHLLREDTRSSSVARSHERACDMFYQGQALFQEQSYRSSEIKYVMAIMMSTMVLAHLRRRDDTDMGDDTITTERNARRVMMASVSNMACARMHRFLLGRCITPRVAAETSSSSTSSSSAAEMSPSDKRAQGRSKSQDDDVSVVPWWQRAVNVAVGAFSPTVQQNEEKGGADTDVDEDVPKEYDSLVHRYPLAATLLGLLEKTSWKADENDNKDCTNNDDDDHDHGAATHMLRVGLSLLAASAPELAVVSTALCPSSDASRPAIVSRAADVFAATGAYDISLDLAKVAQHLASTSGSASKPSRGEANAQGEDEDEDGPRHSLLDYPHGSRLFTHVNDALRFTGAVLPCLFVTDEGRVGMPESALTPNYAVNASDFSVKTDSIAFKRKRFAG